MEESSVMGSLSLPLSISEDIGLILARGVTANGYRVLCFEPLMGLALKIYLPYAKIEICITANSKT
jgi:hypothetical protein